MQGQRSVFDPFPEAVDLNQGSNSNSMDESDDWNMLSPMERRLDLSSELNFSFVNTNNNHHNLRGFSSWDVGESSSRASLQQDHGSNDGLKPDRDSRLEQQLESNIPLNVNLNIGYDDSDGDDDGMGFMDLYKSGRPEPHASGSSCKRKTLEGTSTQPFTGGGSSFFPEASRSLNISSPPVNNVPVNHHEPPNTRIGVQENSQTHFGMRGPVPFNNNNNITSIGNPTRHPNNRQILLNEFLDQTSRANNLNLNSNLNSNNIPNQQPPLIHAPIMPRNAPHFPWGSNNGSRNGGSSSSARIPLERGIRNNVPYHNFVQSSERNLVQDPTNWSLATGSGSTSGGGVGVGGSRPFNALWTPQQNTTTPSQQRSSELPPWTLFPSAEVESGEQRGHFAPSPAGSSSTSEGQSRVSSGGQRGHYQPFSRSGLLMDVPGDDWRALAADIEGRQRLVSEIRQVLNAMRRGENLRAEDYMLFDPFINGVAELHDRHRDMRLDVDNMSYEELLALEERIGDVNTGLSEEVIIKSMKQRKHISFMAISTQNVEPCCICQEEYDTGDNIGSLDCGHDFHTDCIKQWLAQKNICPICKMTGLAP